MMTQLQYTDRHEYKLQAIVQNLQLIQLLHRNSTAVKPQCVASSTKKS